MFIILFTSVHHLMLFEFKDVYIILQYPSIVKR